MKVLLIGATGATGKFVLQNLLRESQITEVVIFVRTATGIKDLKLTEIVTSFDQLEKFQTKMQADVAISCLGTTLKQAGSKELQWLVDYEYQYQFAQLAKSNNVRQFILLSALGASTNSRLFYNKMKGALEDAVKNLNFDRLDILQPSLLIRPNSDRLGERFSEKVLYFFNSIGILKSFQPFKVENLGFIIANLVFEKQKGFYIWPLKDLIKRV